MTELRMGISPCPNDIFIFSGLLLNEVHIKGFTLHTEYLDVENLNQLAQRKSLDIVKISYANYPHCAEHYDLLTAGGALGRGVGPLLLSSNRKWNPSYEVLVPGSHTTANFLLDFWAQKPLKKRYLKFDSLYNYLCCTPNAQGVVIHEKRFTYAHDRLFLIQDLGKYWENHTGHLIPLGAILARKELDTKNITAGIQESLCWAYANRERAFLLCQKHAADLTPEVIHSHIDLYVNKFSYNLGIDGEEAVRFFLQQYEALMLKDKDTNLFRS